MDQNSLWEKFKAVAARIAAQEGFPLAVLLGQAALETGRGSSYNAQSKNNWFGLGAYDANPENAFNFKSMEDSIKYYIDLIKNNPLYARAWAAKDDLVKMVQEIKNAGYATDPDYVNKVLGTSEFREHGGGFNQGQFPAQQQIAQSRQDTMQGFMNQGIESPNQLSPFKQSNIGQQAKQAISPTQYSVKKNDTLWNIAKQTLGSGNRWRELVGYTGEPTKLPIGTKLTIPTQSSSPQFNTSTPSGPRYTPPPPTRTSVSAPAGKIPAPTQSYLSKTINPIARFFGLDTVGGFKFK